MRINGRTDVDTNPTFKSWEKCAFVGLPGANSKYSKNAFQLYKKSSTYEWRNIYDRIQPWKCKLTFDVHFLPRQIRINERTDVDIWCEFFPSQITINGRTDADANHTFKSWEIKCIPWIAKTNYVTYSKNSFQSLSLYYRPSQFIQSRITRRRDYI